MNILFIFQIFIILILLFFGSKSPRLAVAELTPLSGTIYFETLPIGITRIYGSVYGLTPGKHGFHIHQYGDMSKGCDGLGGHYNPLNNNHGPKDGLNRHYGDLGNIVADLDGVARFSMIDDVIKVKDIIGRSVIIHRDEDKFNDKEMGGPRVTCGAIRLFSS